METVYGFFSKYNYNNFEYPNKLIPLTLIEPLQHKFSIISV